MRTIRVKKGQSLLDIALQEYGDATGVFDVVEKNSLRGVTDNVDEGAQLVVSGEPYARRIKDFLSPYQIATLSVEEDRASGIGWMVVEYNFIVG